jgi:hypothetical protein
VNGWDANQQKMRGATEVGLKANLEEGTQPTEWNSTEEMQKARYRKEATNGDGNVQQRVSRASTKPTVQQTQRKGDRRIKRDSRYEKKAQVKQMKDNYSTKRKAKTTSMKCTIHPFPSSQRVQKTTYLYPTQEAEGCFRLFCAAKRSTNGGAEFIDTRVRRANGLLTHRNCHFETDAER